MTRLHTLQQRRERLIEANKQNDYMHSLKIGRYLNALKIINTERILLDRAKHETLNPGKYKFTVTKEMMFDLTNPI